MNIIMTSVVTSVLLAAGAGLIFSMTQKAVYEVQAVPSVRLDDPGHNLVGPDWSGLNRTSANDKVLRSTWCAPEGLITWRLLCAT
jgi:hypothetical protein